MRPTEYPLTFEQEYRKHEFAPLVDLALTVTARAMRRRDGRRAESADGRPHPTGAGLTLYKRAAIAVAVAFVMAAAFSHVYADAPPRSKAGQILVAAVDPGPSSATTRTEKILRKIVESHVSDGLDIYAQEMRAFGRPASIPTNPLEACSGSRRTDSTQVTFGGRPGGIAQAPVAVARRGIEPLAARELFQAARFGAGDGLNVYYEDFRPTNGLLLSLTVR